MRDKKRVKECIKYGITDTLLVTFIITVVFQIFARPIAGMFALTGGTSREIIDVCAAALRIASTGYVFMGFSVAVQGVLQSVGDGVRPLIISLLRLVIFVFPTAYFFTKSENVVNIVWWTFPIAEILTFVIAIFILKSVYKNKVEVIEENTVISR